MSSHRWALVLATWGGSGYFPFAPGTVGSAVAVMMGVRLDNSQRSAGLDSRLARDHSGPCRSLGLAGGGA